MATPTGITMSAIAIFIYAADHYSSLVAAWSMVTFLLAIASIAVGIIFVLRSRKARELARRMEQKNVEAEHRRDLPISKEPGLLVPSFLKAVQFGFRNRAMIAVGMSAATMFIAAVQSYKRHRHSGADVRIYRRSGEPITGSCLG